ncbi:MAG: GNAT family N-acetyltransferase [Anaerolineae bacterium]|nr:GNAT family N-acetyltransferase [Anaerolineae bacterium]
MNLNNVLFSNKYIYFAPIDYEMDAKIVSQWTHDTSYLHGSVTSLSLPLPEAKIKKQFEAIEKLVEENKRFYFSVHAKNDDRLIGYGDIYRISWTNQSGMISLGLGDAKDRGQGYGEAILELLLRFAFDELSLYRLSAAVSEDNKAALKLFQKAGFVEEIRQRERVHRAGRRWDLIFVGILQEER